MASNANKNETMTNAFPQIAAVPRISPTNNGPPQLFQLSSPNKLLTSAHKTVTQHPRRNCLHGRFNATIFASFQSVPMTGALYCSASIALAQCRLIIAAAMSGRRVEANAFDYTCGLRRPPQDVCSPRPIQQDATW